MLNVTEALQPRWPCQRHAHCKSCTIHQASTGAWGQRASYKDWLYNYLINGVYVGEIAIDSTHYLGRFRLWRTSDVDSGASWCNPLYIRTQPHDNKWGLIPDQGQTTLCWMLLIGSKNTLNQIHSPVQCTVLWILIANQFCGKLSVSATVYLIGGICVLKSVLFMSYSGVGVISNNHKIGWRKHSIASLLV